MSLTRGSQRGLTLVEVLISTVLLAMLASACVPLMAQATRLLRETADASRTEIPDPDIDLDELGGLADQVIANPKLFGLDHLPMSGEFTVPWRDDPERPRVKVRVLESAESGSTTDHQWLEFRCPSRAIQREPALRVYRGRPIVLPERPGGAR